jgi:hypothetical protein
LIALNSLNWVYCVPPSASKVTLGKKFAREAPITSLAAAVASSACATSGRRRNTSAGAAPGGLGNGRRLEDCETENDAAAFPISAAMDFPKSYD